MGNLGPLTRTEHRAKTLGGWQARQPDLGTYLWRSPEGLIALTTNQGTLLLGDRHWAHQVWTTRARSQSDVVTKPFQDQRGIASPSGTSSADA